MFMTVLVKIWLKFGFIDFKMSLVKKSKTFWVFVLIRKLIKLIRKLIKDF